MLPSISRGQPGRKQSPKRLCFGVLKEPSNSGLDTLSRSLQDSRGSRGPLLSGSTSRRNTTTLPDLTGVRAKYARPLVPLGSAASPPLSSHVIVLSWRQVIVSIWHGRFHGDILDRSVRISRGRVMQLKTRSGHYSLAFRKLVRCIECDVPHVSMGVARRQRTSTFR